MRRPEKYIPLGVSFWDDDRIVEVGYMAGVLYQQVCLRIRASGADGTITVQRVKRIREYTPGRWKALTSPVPGLAHKGPLISELPIDKGTFVVNAWPRWHQGDDIWAADRERKSSKGGAE